MVGRLLMVGIAVLALASGARSAVDIYSNPCDDLAQWQDNSSGIMTVETGGPSGTYLRFQSAITGSTLSLIPDYGTATPGVNVQAGDKLIFDAMGYAQDFSVRRITVKVAQLLAPTSQKSSARPTPKMIRPHRPALLAR